MPYHERLQDASYESPSGRSFSFSYRTVAREISHRIGSFEFPGINGTLHQDKGISGELYPWTIYIHGQDYDIIADKFNEAISETGAGFLTHPRFGRRRVQIIKSSQNEDLTESAGQAVFNIQFQESLEKEFPDIEESLQFAIPKMADDFELSAVNNYADQVKTTTIGDENSLEQKMLISTASVSAALTKIASLNDEVFTEFNSIINEIEINVSSYIATPSQFAINIISAIRLVSNVPGSIGTKLQGFSNLISSISGAVLNPDQQTKNKMLVDELIGTSAIVAMSESINIALGNSSRVNSSDEGTSISVPVAGFGFRTRGEALAAAVFLRDLFYSLINILDAGQLVFLEEILSNMYIQSIDSYGPSAMVVSSTIKATLDLSFSLPAERTLILTEDSTLINLCYDFYGNIDDQTLDYFILTNTLSIAEIKIIPRGRQVIYYA